MDVWREAKAEAPCGDSSQYGRAQVRNQISVGTAHPTTDPGKVGRRVGCAHQNRISTSDVLY